MRQFAQCFQRSFEQWRRARHRAAQPGAARRNAFIERHRRVGREVSVLRLARRLERHGRRRGGVAGFAEQGQDGRIERRLKSFAHADLSGAKRDGRAAEAG